MINSIKEFGDYYVKSAIDFGVGLQQPILKNVYQYGSDAVVNAASYTNDAAWKLYDTEKYLIGKGIENIQKIDNIIQEESLWGRAKLIVPTAVYAGAGLGSLAAAAGVGVAGTWAGVKGLKILCKGPFVSNTKICKAINAIDEGYSNRACSFIEGFCDKKNPGHVCKILLGACENELETSEYQALLDFNPQTDKLVDVSNVIQNPDDFYVTPEKPTLQVITDTLKSQYDNYKKKIDDLIGVDDKHVDIKKKRKRKRAGFRLNPQAQFLSKQEEEKKKFFISSTRSIDIIIPENANEQDINKIIFDLRHSTRQLSTMDDDTIIMLVLGKFAQINAVKHKFPIGENDFTWIKIPPKKTYNDVKNALDEIFKITPEFSKLTFDAQQNLVDIYFKKK